MRPLIFWCIWLLSGVVAAYAWLGAVCPPAACNFILVLLQAPSLIVGAIVWLVVGILASIAIAAMGAKRSNAFGQGMQVTYDLNAESAIEGLPAFIASPKDTPVYHGFPLLQGSEIEGFRFGAITSPRGDEPAQWGDAYVIAPDGSRAGIVWQAEGEPSAVVCEPSEGRWGVYSFRFRHPVLNEQDLIRNLHECLPELKRYYEQACITHPESVRPMNK